MSLGKSTRNFRNDLLTSGNLGQEDVESIANEALLGRAFLPKAYTHIHMGAATLVWAPRYTLGISMLWLPRLKTGGTTPSQPCRQLEFYLDTQLSLPHRRQYAVGNRA